MVDSVLEVITEYRLCGYFYDFYLISPFYQIFDINQRPLQQLNEDHLQKSWSDPKDSGGQGFEDSSEMLKNYKDLKVWQKSYGLCSELIPMEDS